MTALHYASQRGQADMVAILLRHSDANLPDGVRRACGVCCFLILICLMHCVQAGRTPLFHAINNYHREIVEILLRQPTVSVSARDKVIQVICIAVVLGSYIVTGRPVEMRWTMQQSQTTAKSLRCC